MKKFYNTSVKRTAVLDTFEAGETLKGREITKRLREAGYIVNESSIKMFIYYHMTYRDLNVKKVHGVNHYTAIR